MTYQLHHGNMLDILPMMERESIDAIVTDPPYGLDFMGKDWDHGIPGEHFWREAYRVAKPGSHLLAFGGTRTFHRLACAIEDAGWEIRDTVMWVYGQGFPKSHDVSKAIDREAGAEREVIGIKRHARDGDVSHQAWTKSNTHVGSDWDMGSNEKYMTETSPATPAAAEWDGWGTALKPAWEPIIVARKPIVGTVAENVQRYGTGALNIDQCRIGVDDSDPNHRPNGTINSPDRAQVYGVYARNETVKLQQGRWPANLIHDGSAEVLAGFPNVKAGVAVKQNLSGEVKKYNTYNAFAQIKSNDIGYSDTGSAARFFYCAKASKADRDEGLEGFDLQDCGMMEDDNYPIKTGSGNLRETKRHNGHPTVKPTALMRYLCRLVTPPNGTILDPFMGSGSTGKAAMLEGFNFIGVDTEIEYVEIAARRIEAACEKVGIVVDQPMMFETKREVVDRPKQLILL